MSRLQLIENELSTINPAVFQELCDSFLALRNSNYSALSRIGSQVGKLKTTIGTPDSLLLLPSGKYLFVEHSTNISQGLSKLKGDIEKCLDELKTGILVNQIAEIILCINFNLKPEEFQILKNLLSDTRILLTVYTLDSLSIELHLHHRDLAHQYLGLPLDTGQIVSIDRFINEYNRVSKGISTPLDNPFLHREEELKELQESINHKDFIILTGAPGIGKTKFALQGIKTFLAENLKFSAYCISYKHHTLINDLFQYLDLNKDYILFVDDANRIDAFSQITGFYKAERKGKLKVIITVRNYAFHDISILCHEFAPKRMDLVKFSDQHIVDIIKQQPFGILNPTYHKEIIRIADGNPRLAIMTALLAKDKQKISALADVSELFENYFSTFIKDDSEFANDFNFKCLGLIAFFYTIPYKDRAITSSILNNFGIDYPSFIDAVDKLDKLEVVEIQFQHVKIPEQNLSTYFFYKAFIKDNLLSFEVLLNKYFESNRDRFKDNVIPANNTFGVKNVMDKLQPFLKDYWKLVQTEEEKGFKFLSTFWYYLPSKTLDFVYQIIEDLPTTALTSYKVTYDSNAFSYNKNNVIELLGEFFRFQNELKDSIELTIEYVRKKPEHLPELIHKIREQLTFDREDLRFGFKRQFTLFQILLRGLKKKDLLYSKIFYELSITFLKSNFRHIKGGRHHSFRIYEYPLPNTKGIQDFRKTLWNAIDVNYTYYPNESFDVLQSYEVSSLSNVQGIMEFDVPFILIIINNHLTAESFEHCKYVQEQIRRFKRHSVSHPSFSKLEESFINSEYEVYLKIDWNRLRDKEIHEFDNYREYEKLKEAEIRRSFVFKKNEEVEEFFRVFSYLKTKEKNEWNYNISFDFIVDENFIHDFYLGCKILAIVIESGNNINYIPRTVFRNHLKTAESAQLIWSILQNSEFNLKAHWELSFYDSLDDSLLSQKHVESLINTISSMDGSNTIHFGPLNRFLSIDPNLYQVVLSRIVEKNENGGDLRVWVDLFDVHFENLGEDINLIKKAYIQQEILNNHFDYEGKGLLNILKVEPLFLLEFVENLYSEKKYRLSADQRRLGFVWRINEIEPVLIEVFDFVINKDSYLGIYKHFCNSFFIDIPNDTLSKSKEFLFEYVRKNHNDPSKINVVVDITRHTMREIFEDVVILFLSLNQDVEIFSRIKWRDSVTTGSGDTILADLEAADWRNILSIVEKSKVGIKLIPIKRLLNERIENALKRGDRERQRRFLGRI